MEISARYAPLLCWEATIGSVVRILLLPFTVSLRPAVRKKSAARTGRAGKKD
jgi:hypothetical protein